MRLISFSSSDIDIDRWRPQHLEDVLFCLDLEIEYNSDDGGADMFYVTVATPEAIRRHRAGPVLAKGRIIIISEFNWHELRKEVDAIMAQCEFSTWHESLVALQRFFSWEYESYRS